MLYSPRGREEKQLDGEKVEVEEDEEEQVEEEEEAKEREGDSRGGVKGKERN